MLSRVNGCILLDNNLNFVANAIRLAWRGYSVFPRAVSESFIDFHSEEKLIDGLELNECLILNEIGDGNSDKNIALRLLINLKSFIKLKNNIALKLRAREPIELRSFALRHKIVLHDRRRQLIQKISLGSYENSLKRQGQVR